MGKWNHHRRWTRKNYNNQPPPPSPPNYFDTEFKFRGGWKNTKLPWEERFCLSVGIPWQKVVVAKRYMNCHDNVSNWNDSGGEEAFYNAKQRFWAQINGLPCDAPAPDPNTYVDDIDWNVDVNPDLMLEVDQEYFNPDEAGKVNKQNSSSGWGEMNPSTSDNPWECSREPSNGGEDMGHGWGPWDKSRHVTSHNPWEDGNARGDGAIKNNNWGCADKLWGQTSGVNAGSSERSENNRGNSWNQGNYSFGLVKQTCREYTGNSHSVWENNDRGTRKSRYTVTPWNSQAGGAPENKQWKDRRDNSSAWEQWESQYHGSNHYDPRWHGGSDRSRNGGCLKREASQQYTSRYKSSRFQADDYVTDHHWKKQRNQNRVSYI